MRGLRIAYSPDFGGQVEVDPAVAAAVRRAVERLAELGAVVEETDPGFADPVEAFHTLWFSGGGPRDAVLHRRAARGDGPGAAGDLAQDGAARSALDYLAAVDVRMALGKQMGVFHETYDLLVTPTTPGHRLRGGPGGAGGLRATGGGPSGRRSPTRST